MQGIFCSFLRLHFDWIRYINKSTVRHMRKRKSYISKNFIERIDYCSRRAYRKNQKRIKQYRKTSKSQEAVNKRLAELRLRLYIDMNFKCGDYYLTLTFAEAVEWKVAQKEIQKFMRRLRDLYKRNGKVLKYIYVAEGKSRIHFHVLINREIELYPDIIMKLWPNGYFDQKLYRGQADDAVRIASYFIKEDRAIRQPDKEKAQSRPRRWTGSKNLIKPAEKVEHLKSEFWREDISVPKGYYLDKDSVIVGFSIDGYPFRIYRLIKLE